MRARAKLGWVLCGYVLAVVVAWLAVGANIALTKRADSQASSGMYAFGDALLFLAVFCAASVPATGGALYCMRPYAPFWRALSVAALASSVTGIAAFCVYFAGSILGAGSPLQSWSAGATLRILAAPLIALALALSALFAPLRPTRILLWSVAVFEAAAFAAVVVTWLVPFWK